MSFRLTPEQQALQEKARALAREHIAPKAAHWDRTEEYPWENVERLVEAGFMGMTIPREYGGPGHSLHDALLVVEEMAKVCGITGRIVVEGNMGAIGLLMRYGSEELKRRYAPWVLQGDKPAICISELEAGSDATAMQTTAVKQDGHWVLNGSKSWITGGGISRIHLIFARLSENGLEQGIGALLVEKDAPGLELGRRAHMMGLRGIPETELHFRDCHVPAENLVAMGFGKLMSGYNAQRVGAGTVALGVAQGAYELALDFARERRQFDRPIGEFQGLRWMLADMRVKLDAARLLLHRAAVDLHANGFPDRELAAIAKVYASETAIQISNDALQVYGARGYSRDFPLERMVRDARMFTIGGGTAQTLRNVIGDAILGSKVSQRREG
ncbi:MAG TPA: acyl-CoA dehydrogenase family protein [bacterium]|nr:acyl-CoA dehydrogenase family protein [bacterium]